MAITERSIEVDGLPVHYFEGGEGNGRALLLLSGGIGDAASLWRDVLPPLSDNFHVFAPDLPGFGGSAPLPDLRIESLVRWLYGLLDALEQTDVVIVGHFVGALLARLFAAAEPQYVPALILVNGGTLPQFPAFLPSLIGLPLIGDVVLQLFGSVTCSQKSLDRMVYVKEAVGEDFLTTWRSSASGFNGLMRALVRSSYPEQRTPPVPTLLLWGANDPVMPLADAERLSKDIPGARLTPVAECGSLPPLEAGDTFVFQVTAFLDQLSRAVMPNLPGVGLLHPNQA